MFTAPYNRAGFFAELWMLQYVSNVENWAFGELTYEELDVMFGTHVQVRFFLNSHYGCAVYPCKTAHH